MPKFVDVTDMDLAQSVMGIERACDVTAYGAAGDGITDDTAAIHAARDAAGVGGRLVFPNGTYLVSGLTANVTGQRWDLATGASIKMKTGATKCLYVTADKVTIDGGVFDAANGTAHDWSEQGIMVDDADDVTIRNVEVRDSPMHGVFARRGSRVTVADCRFIDNYSAGVMVQNDVENTEMYDIVITGNYSASSLDTAGGIGVLAGVNVGSTLMVIGRVTITNNTTICPIDPAAETACIGVINCDDWVIRDNVAVGSHIGITTSRGTRCVVSGNRVSSFGGIGIEVAKNMTDCVVSNNTIDGGGVESTVYGSSQSGIQNSLGTVSNMSVLGNTISGCVGALTGITFATSTIKNVSVCNNIVLGDCTQYVGVSIGGSAENITVSGNVFDAGAVTGSIRGLSFLTNPKSKVSVSDNIFTSTSSTGTNYGVSFALAPTASGIAISGNTFKAPSSVGFAAAYFDGSTTNLSFTGNSVDGGSSSTAVNGVEFWNATNGAVISGNQFSNVGAPVRLAATSSVTLQNIKLVGNVFTPASGISWGIRDQTSGGATVADSVFSLDNDVLSVKSTATAGGTTTLDINSANTQVFTGSTTQTCKLPSTLVIAGRKFTVINNSTGLVTVTSSDNSTIATLPSGAVGQFTALQLTPTAVTHWAHNLNKVSASALVASTTTAVGFGSIELGHASDTTISRTSAGQLAVEGNPLGTKVAVPASAGAAGVPGNWAAESGWLYICVAENAWERVAIGSW